MPIAVNTSIMQADAIAKKYIGSGTLTLSPPTPLANGKAPKKAPASADEPAEPAPARQASVAIAIAGPGKRNGEAGAKLGAPARTKSPDENNAPEANAKERLQPQAQRRSGSGSDGAILDMERLRSLPKLL